MNLIDVLEKVVIEQLPQILSTKSGTERDRDRAIIFVFILVCLGPLSFVIIKKSIFQYLFAGFFILVTNAVFWYLITSGIIKGKITGAEYALKNPPPVGETWIEIVDEGELLYKSEIFDFNPPKLSPSDKKALEFERRSKAYSAYPKWKKLEIVIEFKRKYSKTRHGTKKKWAESKGITIGTLRNYERLYDEMDEVERNEILSNVDPEERAEFK